MFCLSSTVYVYRFVCIWILISIYLSVYLYIYTYTYVYIYRNTPVYIYIYIYMSVCQNFLFMAGPWMFWGGVLSLYKDSVTCFCEVSLCSCVSKKTIRLTDLTRCLPCPLLPFAALYCSLLPFTALYLPFTCTALCLPRTALYCTLLPFTALCCPLLHEAVAHETIW